MNEQQSILFDSFRAVSSIVRDFEVRGRVCRGAALKLEYQRRYPLISQQALGFRKFGDFLRAAAAAGYIIITPRKGVDLELSLPSPSSVPRDQTPATPVLQSSLEIDAVEQPRQTPIEVRPDLWRAFNSRSSIFSYSRERDLAVRTVDASANDTSLVRIPSLEGKAVDWMRAFIGTHEAELGSELSHALRNVSNRHQFTLMLRARPHLLRLWRNQYLQQVIDDIEKWASAHMLQPKHITAPFQKEKKLATEQNAAEIEPAKVITTSVSESQEGSLVTEELNRRFGQHIDALIDDLLRLRGFLEVVNKK